MDLAGNRLKYLSVAITFTWLAGLGRYWDHPDAWWWQYAGLGSLAYIFIFGLLLWAIAIPFTGKGWSYTTVVTFLGFTAPLAWLYAIPVERFLPEITATKTNLVFLAIVAVWRVALYLKFLHKFVGTLGWTVLLTFLPLSVVIVGLSVLNLEHATFQAMAGTDNASYNVVLVLSLLSFITVPFFLVFYIVSVFMHYRRET